MHSRDLPPLPATAEALLSDSLAALGLARDPSLADGLRAHARLLLAWNEAINLTAIREPTDVVRHHLLDSLAAVRPLRERGIDAFVDLGTGGGFPGLPLALALPARRALLVDSTGKKAGFVATVIADLVAEGWLPSGRVDAVARRAEALAAGSDREGWPAVVARAVAPLSELAELSLPLVRIGGLLAAWKRNPIEPELAEAESAIQLLGGGEVEILPTEIPGLEDHLLVLVRKLRPGPPGYPRDPSARRRRRL